MSSAEVAGLEETMSHHHIPDCFRDMETSVSSNANARIRIALAGKASESVMNRMSVVSNGAMIAT